MSACTTPHCLRKWLAGPRLEFSDGGTQSERKKSGAQPPDRSHGGSHRFIPAQPAAAHLPLSSARLTLPNPASLALRPTATGKMVAVVAAGFMEDPSRRPTITTTEWETYVENLYDPSLDEVCSDEVEICGILGPDGQENRERQEAIAKRRQWCAHTDRPQSACTTLLAPFC